MDLLLRPCAFRLSAFTKTLLEPLEFYTSSVNFKIVISDKVRASWFELIYNLLNY